MRSLLLAAVLGLILAGSAPGLFAEPAWSWSTSLDTIVGTGDTRYLMELPGSPYGGSSELIFPLSTLLEGVTFRGERVGGRHDGRREWSFEASIAVNLLAPFGKMEDYDWWMYTDIPKRLWSYTESDVSMTWLVLSAAWRMPLASGRWGRLDGVLGYRLQYVDQKVNGLNGWHTDEVPPYDDIPDGFFQDTYAKLALTYWVMWNVPTAGLAVTLKPVPGVAVGMEAGLAVPIVADEDDHVLRNKLSTAAGLGFGGYAELAVRYSWGKAESRVRPYLSFIAGMMALKANTLQTQAWYGDDPGYAGDETGMVISGIDHQISTKQFTVTLSCGAAY